MLTLYRADQKWRKTIPEKYNTFGITSKQLNSGDDPEPHRKYGWLATNTNHIHVNDAVGQHIYDTTQYLSFTTDLNKAQVYLGTSRCLSFEQCAKENAEAYLFTLNIEKKDLTAIGQGVYTYSFNCNYDKIKSDPKFYSFVASLTSCEICHNYPGYSHQILLIDAAVHLEDKKATFPDAYSNACRDKEWLVMSADPMVGMNAKGFQSRIPVADFWTVDFYKYL